MVIVQDKPRCDGAGRAAPAATVRLPVLPSHGTPVRKSRTSRWRAASLIAVHLLIIGHVVQWLITGRTLSPVEPSETMYTLNDGHLNAGFIFLAASLLATLIFGRFVCGWGCHVVAYQDLCAWLLKKIGIKPKPFRSRILILAPLALALYMFAWPTVYRWWAGFPAPKFSNYLMTTEFWKTFPGPGIALLTVVVCGFLIVYVLGGKGFCTYGCPYGGLFGVVDQVAVGRILVTDACEHCGHCTAVCSSNVRVHEEVALYGMVVDPGCMKCMDCVSVCPNDALYFGFTAPRIRHSPSRGLQPARPSRVRPYDFGLWEEIVMAVVGLGALLVFRGLYGQIPLLLAMGLAAILGYLTIKSVRVFRTANVRLQNLQLKRGGRLTRSGVGFVAAVAVLFLFTAHSAAVQYNVWRSRTLFAALEIGDQVWFPGNRWWEQAFPAQRARVDEAIAGYERADRWGLTATVAALQDLVWLHLARGGLDAAEATTRRLIELTPDRADVYRGLAGVLRKAGRLDEAEVQYRHALRIDPTHSRARTDLASMLLSVGRQEDALAVYREGLQVSPADTDARYTLALALLSRTATQNRRSDIEEAIQHLQRVVADRPTFAEAHYNLGVAVFMSGRPADALPHVRESIRLAPDDPQARQFLSVVLQQLGTFDSPPRP